MGCVDVCDLCDSLVVSKISSAPLLFLVTKFLLCVMSGSLRIGVDYVTLDDRKTSTNQYLLVNLLHGSFYVYVFTCLEKVALSFSRVLTGFVALFTFVFPRCDSYLNN